VELSVITSRGHAEARQRRQKQQLCAFTIPAGNQIRQWRKNSRSNKPGWIARSKKNAGTKENSLP